MTSNTTWVGMTHTGLVRDHNEDSYFVSEEAGVGMVADGMGGHESGEVASALAVQTVQQALAQGVDLVEALRQAHTAIVKHPKSGGAKSMGTTGVLVRVQGSQAEVAWVGDSRAYLFDGDRLYPLTKDHTPVQEMVDAGRLTVDQARTHKARNQINQALGIPSRTYPVKPGYQKAYFDVGSVILLCSDGLTEHLSDQRIFQQLSAGTRNLEAVAQRLIDEALDEGGTDNISVVLVKRLAGT